MGKYFIGWLVGAPTIVFVIIYLVFNHKSSVHLQPFKMVVNVSFPSLVSMVLKASDFKT